MSRRASNANSSLPKYGRYEFVCTTSEWNDQNDRQASYGVQFAWRPTSDHLKGGGTFWKGHIPMQPEATLSGLRALATRPADFEEEGEGESNRNRDTNGRSAGGDKSNDQEDDTESQDEIRPVKQKPPAHSRQSSRNATNASGAASASAARGGEKDDETPFRNLFVTCNGNAIRIYEAHKKHHPTLLQLFEDDDPEEMFYCVGWTYNADGAHDWWACASGKKGVVRVINVSKGALIQTLIGHGEAINDLKIHPRDPALLLTASKDESLRLWNLRTGVTVAVFSGLKGHRGEVVHADFSIDGSKFASCGIDNSIRIWDVFADDSVVAAIKESHKIADRDIKDSYVYEDETGTRKKFKVPITQFPFFVTRKVHKHYVDCVMWVGELLLSKSVHNRMFLWAPEAERDSLASPACNYTLLDEYILDACNVWFIRFAIDRSRRLVACGNEKGIVSIFDLTQIPTKGGSTFSVSPKDKHKYNSQFVRQCAFSEDGSILLAVDDTASVVQYERVDKE